MHFEGSEQIKASKEAIFSFLLDPNKVAGCAPGFISMDILAPDHFKPTLGVGVGAVKAKFTLDVQLQNIREPDHGEVKAHGVAAGSAVDLVAIVDLVPVTEGETAMNWVSDVTVSGTIASVGARLLQGVAERLTGQFFDCLKSKLQASKADTTAASSSSE